MIDISSMHCEARVANYYGDFQEMIRRYSDDFFPLPLSREDVKNSDYSKEKILIVI